ncbi:MAG: ABC transporter permease, partial [Chloroflexia bacterium]
MEKKALLPTIVGWGLLILGCVLGCPGMPAVVLSLSLHRPLKPLEFALVAYLVPLVVALPLLQAARRWFTRREGVFSGLMMALGGLWTLAGPLAALDLSLGSRLLATQTVKPLGLLLDGSLPPLLGLVFWVRAWSIRPTARAAIHRVGGWVYLAVALLPLGLGLSALVRGETTSLLSWLCQLCLVLVMAAWLFEQPTAAMGAFFGFLGLVIGLLFLPAISPEQVSTFVLNPAGGRVAWSVPNAVFPTALLVGLLVVGATGMGLWQAVREKPLGRSLVGALLGAGAVAAVVLFSLRYGLSSGIFLVIVFLLVLGLSAWQIWRTRETNAILGSILFLFILAFLLWASRGQEYNFTGLLQGMLEAATPIALGALSGIWCERSAVINIAIEGMLLSGAFTSVVVASATKSLLLGLLVGMLTGAVLAAILAVLAIRFKVNQIIAGTAINIFSVGVTSFLSARLLAQRQDLNASENFQLIATPVLGRIPVIGPVFLQNNLIIYLMLILVVVTHTVLFSTRWGLRSRAVGEHPLAA